MDAHALVVANLWLVRRALARIPHAPADHEDLLQEGALALLRCAVRWNPRGASFAAYAYRRVRGAILDALRAPSFGGSLTVARSDQELRQRAGLPHRPSVVSLSARARRDGRESEDAHGATVGDTVASEPRDADAAPVCDELLSWLSARDARVVRLYFGGMTQLEVARETGLCDSRVSQIVSRSLAYLRARARRSA